MKHIKYASVITFAASVMAVASVHAKDIGGGVITFEGRIDDSTCSVEGGSGTEGGIDDFTVVLGGVKSGLLPRAGITAGQKAFNVIVGGNGQSTCENGHGVTMYFVPTSQKVSAENGNLDNNVDAEGDLATNVQIQLLDANKQPIDLRQPQAGAQKVTIQNNTAEMTYYAQYFSTGSATSGRVETNVEYDVDYE